MPMPIFKMKEELKEIEEETKFDEGESDESECESDESECETESECERGDSKSIMHYTSSQKILLVGEGDFSFALSLARAFGTAYNMVATSLDSLEMLGKKYNNGVENVRELEDRGCIVLHGIDATQMSQHYFLSTQRFDRVIYNFPHVGFMFPEDSFCQIKMNKQLVKGFLMNAKLLLMRPKGEVHVSHKEGQPYNQWDLAKKAAKAGLVFHHKVPFCRTDYPGYSNKRAHGFFADNSFPLFPASTFIFHFDNLTT
ncbi:hypothetical protein BVRB_5g121820 [Beta vulgaris subsp. vulgaris]|nr:hypothetical protein BVRB_5g121820 [Beta vulgaris subsp. vulgaris]